jgi:hypothetical protein
MAAPEPEGSAVRPSNTGLDDIELCFDYQMIRGDRRDGLILDDMEA